LRLFAPAGWIGLNNPGEKVQTDGIELSDL